MAGLEGITNAVHGTEKRYMPIEALEVRKSDNGATIATGYAVRFEQLSDELGGFREKVRKGSFAKSLSERAVKAFWNHNSDYVLGSTENDTLKLWEDETGLRFELELPDTTAGMDAEKLIKRGDVKGVSFGFRTIKDEWEEKDDRSVVRTLIEVKLFEISPTAIPAYPQSDISLRTAQEAYEKYKAEAEAARATQENELKRAETLRDLTIKQIGMEVDRHVV